jgi:hypothetical protein
MPHGHSWARRRQHFNEGQLPGILEEGAGIPEKGAARPAPVPVGRVRSAREIIASRVRAIAAWGRIGMTAILDNRELPWLMDCQPRASRLVSSGAIAIAPRRPRPSVALAAAKATIEAKLIRERGAASPCTEQYWPLCGVCLVPMIALRDGWGCINLATNGCYSILPYVPGVITLPYCAPWCYPPHPVYAVGASWW